VHKGKIKAEREKREMRNFQESSLRSSPVWIQTLPQARLVLRAHSVQSRWVGDQDGSATGLSLTCPRQKIVRNEKKKENK
jgi:hypothetical protein